jgi:hypothetical protein
MSIIYSENQTYVGPKFDLTLCDATAKCLEHYSNALFLIAVQQKPKDFAERHQATKELTICERKMTWWKRMPNFDQQRFVNEVAKMKAMWKTSAK